MGNDDQIGFDIEFDDRTQAWLDWVAPEPMESQIRKFLTETLPGIPEGEWWKPPLSTQIMEAAKELFGDWAGFIAPENHERADGFIRFLGECYVRRTGMNWANYPERGVPLYTDFGPAVQYGDDVRSVVSMSKTLFRENYGPGMVEYNMADAGPKGRTVM